MKTRWIISAVLLAQSALAVEPWPRCNEDIKIISAETAPLYSTRAPTGQVVLEFTVDELGFVSEPRVVESSNARLNQEALTSVVLWRYVAPGKQCRQRATVTYKISES